jgi:PKD repeat protein
MVSQGCEVSRFSRVPIIIIVFLAMFAVTPVLADAPSANAGDDQTVDQGINVTLDGSGSTGTGGVVGWNWSLEYLGGTVHLEGETVEFTFDIPGVFDITLTVVDADGLTGADVVRITVQDTEPPVAVAGPDLEVELGRLPTLDGSASTDNVGIVSWLWSVRLRNITLVAEEEGEIVIVDIDPGVYIATLTVTDAAGNEGVDEVLVHVEAPRQPRAETAYEIRVEAGYRVTFDGTYSSPVDRLISYVWTFEYDQEEMRLKGTSPSFKFITPGDYWITLTVTDKDGFWDNASTRVIVRDTTDPVPRILVSKDVVGRTKITLDGSWSEDTLDIVNWTWRIHHEGGTYDLHGERVEYTHDGPGDYEVDLIVKDAAGNDAMATHTFTVKEEEEDGIPLLAGLTIIVAALTASAVAMLYIRSRFKGEPGDPDND